MKWEKKRNGAAGYEQFAIYKEAIQDGFNKLCTKYYRKFDEKPMYVLMLSKSNSISLIFSNNHSY